MAFGSLLQCWESTKYDDEGADHVAGGEKKVKEVGGENAAKPKA